MDPRREYDLAFAEVFDASADELDDSFTLDTVQRWDSMAHLALISELEDRFDVIFEADDILHFESYSNGMEILKRYGIEF